MHYYANSNTLCKHSNADRREWMHACRRHSRNAAINALDISFFFKVLKPKLRNGLKSPQTRKQHDKKEVIERKIQLRISIGNSSRHTYRELIQLEPNENESFAFRSFSTARTLLCDRVYTASAATDWSTTWLRPDSGAYEYDTSRRSLARELTYS